MKCKIPIYYQNEAQRDHMLKLLASVTVKVSKPYRSGDGWRVYVTVNVP